MRSLLLLVALGALLVIWSGAAGDAPALPWEAYWRLVDETDQKVGMAEQSPAQAPSLLQGQADRWKSITQVTVPDGETLIVNPGLLIDLLDAAHPDWKGLHALLAQMKASRPRESLTTFNSQDAAAVQAILARPEYAWTDSTQQNLLQELWQKISDFLGRLLPSGEVTGTIDLRPFFTIGVFLVLVLVLYFSSRDVFRELVQEASLEEDDGGEEKLTAARAMQRAQASAGSGDHRHAVRYLYLSALLVLEERGLLRYDRSRTNREYLSSIREHAQLALVLRQLVEVFDRVWYGYQPIDDDSFDRYVEQVNRLKEQK